ncbi:phosphoserine phosphatase [Xylona heveae TC161]|uniref:Phosphoserine phosphatase n=1 Tax=Xylona heveae (strain CBS 132557 / TC161) TaxID=1328760 RepID=A0A164ZQJ7_XYLHT|nr:phosphoserine phosphatase [Xylona heveae TC161]KZF19382.1 phosphoserine phosphatase [Xylona heveae TC161]
MSADQLPALKSNPKFIFFTDFDGTITMKDSNDYLTDNLGFGPELRRKGNIEVLENRETFRDAFKEMLDSIKHPFNECVQTLVDNIKLDPHFNDFYKWALEHNVPVVVLSSGMVPIIRALLEHLVGPDAAKIQIISNDVKPRKIDGKIPEDWENKEAAWEIEYHDDSSFGHDKSLAIRPYANLPADKRPTLFYAGDGVSDLSAARETDLLFAKKGHDLVTYCEREGVPFTLFEDWNTILENVQAIYSGKTDVKSVAAAGVEAVRHGGNKV